MGLLLACSICIHTDSSVCSCCPSPAHRCLPVCLQIPAVGCVPREFAVSPRTTFRMPFTPVCEEPQTFSCSQAAPAASPGSSHSESPCVTHPPPLHITEVVPENLRMAVSLCSQLEIAYGILCFLEMLFILQNSLQ